jgi:hypothetical protein
MNIEQGILNIEVVFTSSFNIPCSLFDIQTVTISNQRFYSPTQFYMV